MTDFYNPCLNALAKDLGLKNLACDDLQGKMWITWQWEIKAEWLAHWSKAEATTQATSKCSPELSVGHEIILEKCIVQGFSGFRLRLRFLNFNRKNSCIFRNYYIQLYGVSFVDGVGKVFEYTPNTILKQPDFSQKFDEVIEGFITADLENEFIKNKKMTLNLVLQLVRYNKDICNKMKDLQLSS